MRSRQWLACGVLLALVSHHVELGAADEKWFAAATDSVRVLSNHSPAAASRVLGELTAAAGTMTHLAGVEPPQPIRAFAVKNSNSLRELVPQYWERRGVRPQAAAYLGEHAAFIAIRTDLPDAQRSRLLQHEYVHLLSAARAPEAPAWLDEGLSEFWGSLTPDGDRIIVGRPPAAHLAILRSKRWLPLADMLQRERGTLPKDRAEADRFYAQSWALVHYLLLGRGDAGSLPFIPEHDHVTAALDATLRDYVSAARFREVALPAPPPHGAPPTASPVSEARSLAERAGMLVFGERPDAAVPLARRALSKVPEEPLALEVMGTCFFLRNQPDEARRWLTQALEANPASGTSALYLALLETSAPERERYLVAAVRANPGLAVAWQRLGAIYQEDGRLNQARRWCRQLSTAPLAAWLARPLQHCGSRP